MQMFSAPLANFLFHQLNIAWFPGLIEPRLERSVKSQDHEPAFAGNRLDPVAFRALGSLGAEPDIDRAVAVDLEILVLAAEAREPLIVWIIERV